MAMLAPEGCGWAVQQIDGEVLVHNAYTGEVIVQFNPQDHNETAKAQATIHFSAELTDEQKCFAHFWAGYFYAHSGMGTNG